MGDDDSTLSDAMDAQWASERTEDVARIAEILDRDAKSMDALEAVGLGQTLNETSKLKPSDATKCLERCAQALSLVVARAAGGLSRATVEDQRTGGALASQAGAGPEQSAAYATCA